MCFCLLPYDCVLLCYLYLRSRNSQAPCLYVANLRYSSLKSVIHDHLFRFPQSPVNACSKKVIYDFTIFRKQTNSLTKCQQNKQCVVLEKIYFSNFIFFLKLNRVTCSISFDKKWFIFVSSFCETRSNIRRKYHPHFINASASTSRTIQS